MGKCRTRRRHGHKEVEIRLTGDVSAAFPVFISYAGDALYTVNYDHVISQFTKGDAVSSGVRRLPHHGSFAKDTKVYAWHGAEMVLWEPKIPSGSDRLLKWIVPPDRLEAILGDLAERLRIRSRPGNEHAALQWYSRQLRWTTLHEILRLLSRICAFAYLLQKLGLL